MIIFDVESRSLSLYSKLKMRTYKMFIFDVIESKKQCLLTSSSFQGKISSSQPLLSSKNIILGFVITARQVYLSLISPNAINNYLRRSETCHFKNNYI